LRVDRTGHFRAGQADGPINLARCAPSTAMPLRNTFPRRA
jgi:hypothetical protein